jgi:hypothetical protein
VAFLNDNWRGGNIRQLAASYSKNAGRNNNGLGPRQ